MSSNSDFKIVTGDHAEINAIKTRGHEKKCAREALPKKAQEILDMEIRRYDGRCTKEAEKWLKAIDEWIVRNDLKRTEAFDLLLSEEAATLWKNVKTEETSEAEARNWFLETFTIKKSIFDKIRELAMIQQDQDERFATFEIRVLKIVDEVLSSGLSRDEIVTDVISSSVRDKRLKEALTMKPKMTQRERNELAKIYEKSESIERSNEILTMKPASYADKFKEGLRKHDESERGNHRPYIRQEPRRFNQAIEHRRFELPQSQGRQEQLTRERKMPTVSLKHIAKRLYNRQKGLAEPAGGELKAGQCFCCGEDGHRRFECPLKDMCLICGKSGHNFRNCHLLESRRRYNNDVKKIACVIEEVECRHGDNDDYEDDFSSEGQQHEVERRKNANDPFAHISSMGSQI